MDNLNDKLLVTILMPCLNEAETIAGCVQEAFDALKENDIPGEVLVADNGSTDGSVEIAQRTGARVIHVSEKGYGNALKEGIKAALGKYILMGDADGSYDFRELPQFFQMLKKGHELVMGCRLPKGGGQIREGAMPWKHRWIGNPVLSALGRLFFSAPVDDFHCGLRAFDRKAILDLNLKTKGMEFASEMVVKATIEGLKIAQVPITLRPDGRSRPPHLRSWRDGWRHLRFMLLYSPTWLFMIPGIFLLIAGLFGYAFLLPSPLKIGSVTFDINSLLVFNTILMSGFQITAFGLLIKAYAARVGLLPHGDYWLKIINGRPVEWGILIGFLFMAAGTFFLALAVLEWREAGFGPLSYQDSLRMVIPALTGIGLGIQAIVFGFALAVLGINR
jgi:glycosyltransferase involved in cell wall biosynthesis